MSEAQEAPIEAGQVESPAEEGQASVWYDTAPDEVKGYIQNKGWDDPIKAVTSYQELEKFRGASEDQLLKLPKDGEDMGAVWDKLGRPESADKYELAFPDGVQVDEQYVNGAKELAHKIGLNNEQMQALAEYQAMYEQNMLGEMQKQTEAQQAAEIADLQREWGAGFEERAELGRRFVRDNLPDGVDKGALLGAIEGAIGSANMLRLFGNAGQKFAADSVPKSEGDRPFGYTPEQAKADRTSLMNEIKADETRLKNYNAQIGPDYEKMQRLIKIISS